MPDIEPTQMPDGTVISGRAALRRYFKETGTTHVSDYNQPGGYWDKIRAERAKVYIPGSGFDSARRKEALSRAYDKLRK